VPGEDCVLVRDRTALETLGPVPELPVQKSVTLPARWDGQDLEEVQTRTRIDVVAALTNATFAVAFCGFSPGFAYMQGLPQSLHLPRRDRPRPHVPAGSIAIAAGYIAVYPTASPGGWHLLGHCDTLLFDPSWPEPALLTPGTQVRFA
jgi:KipI family sensor histidine kinase inhibitor